MNTVFIDKLLEKANFQKVFFVISRIENLLKPSVHTLVTRNLRYKLKEFCHDLVEAIKEQKIRNSLN